MTHSRAPKTKRKAVRKPKVMRIVYGQHDVLYRSEFVHVIRKIHACSCGWEGATLSMAKKHLRLHAKKKKQASAAG